MFENHIPGPSVSAGDIATNSPLAMCKLLVAAATQKSDELAEIQAKLEAQRIDIFWLNLEKRATLARARKLATNENSDIKALKKIEETITTTIDNINGAIIRAAALEARWNPFGLHVLIEAASAEMKKCRASTSEEIEDRHITADKLAKTSRDISGLIHSLAEMCKEISRIADENEKDTEAERQLAEAREVLGLRLAT